jgi:hypothetical protein
VGAVRGASMRVLVMAAAACAAGCAAGGEYSPAYHAAVEREITRLRAENAWLRVQAATARGRKPDGTVVLQGPPGLPGPAGVSPSAQTVAEAIVRSSEFPRLLAEATERARAGAYFPVEPAARGAGEATAPRTAARPHAGEAAARSGATESAEELHHSPYHPSRDATLGVIVLPWGYVSIDGGPEQESPVAYAYLPPGTHRIRVRNPDVQCNREITIELAPGERNIQRFDLRSGWCRQ